MARYTATLTSCQEDFVKAITDIVEVQLKDNDIKPILRFNETGRTPDWKIVSAKSLGSKVLLGPVGLVTSQGWCTEQSLENHGERRRVRLLPTSKRHEVLREIHGGVGSAPFPKDEARKLIHLGSWRLL